MRLLGLDVGDRRIGLAISDETGLIATPLTVLRRSSKVEDYVKISRLIREQSIQGLVIGQPLRPDGTAGPQAQRIERYAAALGEALQVVGLDLPIIFWDERLSTQRAEEMMVAAGHKTKARQARARWHGRIDAVAAAVILQDYLDEARAQAAKERQPSEEQQAQPGHSKP
jgi:putative Holliday junction resolvase